MYEITFRVERTARVCGRIHAATLASCVGATWTRRHLENALGEPVTVTVKPWAPVWGASA